MSRLAVAFSDSLVIARRNVIKIKRVPEILVFVLISPIMFVLLFSFVFGGATVLGEAYNEFLIGGIFAQTIVFGATFTGAGLAEDMSKGIIDRFRSLPMSRSAVVVGRTASDVIYNALTLVVMSLTGLIVGWGIHNGWLNALAAYGLLLLFGYSISWIMAYVGLLVPSVEVINNASFIVIFPLTFIANTFVPLETLPSVLRTIAEWNPVSAVTQASRELFGNIPPGTPEPTVWPLQNPVLYTMIWVVICIAVGIFPALTFGMLSSTNCSDCTHLRRPRTSCSGGLSTTWAWPGSGTPKDSAGSAFPAAIRCRSTTGSPTPAPPSRTATRTSSGSPWAPASSMPMPPPSRRTAG